MTQPKPHATEGFATRAIHLGYDPLSEEGALNPPLYLTATYTQENIEAFDAIRTGEREGYIYGRTKNPTQALLEQRLASLEGAEAGLVTASGMAAISSTLLTLLQSGDEIVVEGEDVSEHAVAAAIWRQLGLSEHEPPKKGMLGRLFK